MNQLLSFVRLPFLVSISVAVAACGGGGGGDTSTGVTDETISEVTDDTISELTGQFIDSAVGGLTYTCSSGKSGVTDFNGEYTCNEGDTVTFSINGFVIGSATAADVITPNTIAGDNEQATNIAQLLQTIDSDNDPSNGINIAQDGTLYDVMATMADNDVTLEQGDFDTTVQAYLDTAGLELSLVDATTAESHLNDSIASLEFDAASIKAALAGKVVYPSKPTPAYSEEWIVAADGLTATGTGVDGYGAYGGNLTITYTDTSFTVISDDPEDSPVTFTVSAITDAYVETDLGKIYYSQEEAYTDAIIATFAGNKVYPQQSSRDYSQEWAFDASGATVTVSGVDEWGALVDHGVAIYSGATITLINKDVGDDDYNVENTFTVLDITQNKIRVQDADGNEFGIYYSQEEAYVGI